MNVLAIIAIETAALGIVIGLAEWNFRRRFLREVEYLAREYAAAIRNPPPRRPARVDVTTILDDRRVSAEAVAPIGRRADGSVGTLR